MGLSNMLQNELTEVYNMMAKKKCSDTLLKDIILHSFATPQILEKLGTDSEVSTRFENIISEAFQYGLDSPTQNMATTRGTLFGAYNAVTGYFQNVRKYKSAEDQFVSVTEGTGRTITQKAFDLCLSHLN